MNLIIIFLPLNPSISNAEIFWNGTGNSELPFMGGVLGVNQQINS